MAIRRQKRGGTRDQGLQHGLGTLVPKDLGLEYYSDVQQLLPAGIALNQLAPKELTHGISQSTSRPAQSRAKSRQKLQQPLAGSLAFRALGAPHLHQCRDHREAAGDGKCVAQTAFAGSTWLVSIATRPAPMSSVTAFSESGKSPKFPSRTEHFL
jgi:hypothetical protein